jgi:hypothetical protein
MKRTAELVTVKDSNKRQKRDNDYANKLSLIGLGLFTVNVFYFNILYYMN